MRQYSLKVSQPFGSSFGCIGPPCDPKSPAGASWYVQNCLMSFFPSVIFCVSRPRALAASPRLMGRPQRAHWVMVHSHCSGSSCWPIIAPMQVRSNVALCATLVIFGSVSARRTGAGRLTPEARSITVTGLSPKAYAKRRILKSGCAAYRCTPQSARASGEYVSMSMCSLLLVMLKSYKVEPQGRVSHPAVDGGASFRIRRRLLGGRRMDPRCRR